jgi:hypothetical protein
MVLQRNIAPLIWKYIALGRVERIRTGHLSPLFPDDLSCPILHLIKIGKGGYRVLTGCKSRCL